MKPERQNDNGQTKANIPNLWLHYFHTYAS